MTRPSSAWTGGFAGSRIFGKPNDGSHAYDWANRMITADGGSAETDMYDAFGRLASRTNSSGSYKYFYDLAGHVALTQTASGAVVQPEIYIADRHFGSIISGSTVFLHTDWLGTGRLWTTLTGANYRTCENLPFGDGQACQLSSPESEFAGETGQTGRSPSFRRQALLRNPQPYCDI